jgi:phage terminase large subunit
VRIEIPYIPRDKFDPFHEREQRWAVLVVHRRAGKTTSLLADMLRRAILGAPDGRYAFIAPLLSQAKTIAWDILKQFSFDLTEKAHESELRIDLINGARIRLFGADNYDALRGQRLDGVAMDEYADIAPEVFDEVIRAALADRQGWGIFSGTPKGQNHFYHLAEYAKKHPDWFYLELKASESGYGAQSELESAKLQMSPEVYQQEFECSWIAPRSGSYYGDLLNTHAGQVDHHPYDPSLPVEVACDLGFTDSSSWWYWQTYPDGYRIIDFDEGDNKTIDYWCDLLQAKGYKYSTIWLPHDARAKSFQTGKSTIEQMLARDMPVRISPELKIQHGIDAVKLQIPKWRFHEMTTQQGIYHLKMYHRKWNPKTKSYSDTPRHDEHSHAADAARYMALVQKEHIVEAVPVRPTVTSIDKAFSLEVLWSDRDYDRPTDRI